MFQIPSKNRKRFIYARIVCVRLEIFVTAMAKCKNSEEHNNACTSCVIFEDSGMFGIVRDRRFESINGGFSKSILCTQLFVYIPLSLH